MTTGWHRIQKAVGGLLLAGMVLGGSSKAWAQDASSPYPELPTIYAPQEEAPRWNSNNPSIVRDQEELSRLKVVVPQWLQQGLTFPAPGEIVRQLGKDDAVLREKADSAVRAALAPAIPLKGMADRMIPMSRWAILYEDWRRYGGTDVYVVKFQSGPFAVMAIESSNYLIVVLRDPSLVPATDLEGMLRRVKEYADNVLAERLKPDAVSDLRVFRHSLNPTYAYGYYTSKLDKLISGDEDTTLTESAAAGRPSAVRYFTNGQFAAFMSIKPVTDPADMENPFQPRFKPLHLNDPDQVPFWEKGADGSNASVRKKQIDEYLGTFLFDENGNRLSDKVPLEDLEKTFLELSTEQQLAIVEKKMIDEYVVSGMQAFNNQNYNDAIQYWLRILQLDPENPRAAILLNLAVKMRAKQRFQGDVSKARSESAVNDAVVAVNRQRSLLALDKERKDQDTARERAILDYRTKALGFLSERNFSESLKMWNRILEVDPGNSNAILFRDICEMQVKKLGSRVKFTPDGRGAAAAPTRSTTSSLPLRRK